MVHFSRKNEVFVLLYRILLVYIFYFVARVLFYFFNASLFESESFGSFLKICFYGLLFDTSAMLYVNSLFIIASIIPFFVNSNKGYQKGLFYLYFTTNLLFYALNFVDFIYYKFNFARTTLAVLDVIGNESNKVSMFFRFFITYWYVFLLFFCISFVWILLYKKVTVIAYKVDSKWKYVLSSIILFFVAALSIIIGIRGGYAKSSRPINLIDANRHVTKTQQGDLVLNTPFAFLRTLGVKNFKKTNYNIPNSYIEENFHPYKQYQNDSVSKPNIVLIITESMGREYIGSFNKNSEIKHYVGYTPFIDSLAQESLIFTNAYANGYKSIHGMSSILAGIPSFRDAFTSSAYVQQDIQSVVSCVKEMGYDTSFFHGAPNGSMGFLGFGNILGFDHYYGKTEYNNDADFDGSWGIWDEPFLQFMKQQLDNKKNPFFSTIFTVSSHEPYKIPSKYNGKFPKGSNPMHEAVGYTDFAFKKFFESAKKMKWFENTIFIITADHSNISSYEEEYSHKMLNRIAVPILIYSPNKKFKGVNTEYAQHIDIYPTILDAIGYQKSFRSWGRSLLANKTNETPYLINSIAGLYYFAKGNYFCTFDGTNLVGLYDKEDKKLANNLKSAYPKIAKDFEKQCKAILQDYYEKIIDKKLGKQKK